MATARAGSRYRFQLSPIDAVIASGNIVALWLKALRIYPDMHEPIMLAFPFVGFSPT